MVGTSSGQSLKHKNGPGGPWAAQRHLQGNAWQGGSEGASVCDFVNVGERGRRIGVVCVWGSVSSGSVSNDTCLYASVRKRARRRGQEGGKNERARACVRVYVKKTARETAREGVWVCSCMFVSMCVCARRMRVCVRVRACACVCRFARANVEHLSQWPWLHIA